jgi:hypothetical protein
MGLKALLLLLLARDLPRKRERERESLHTGRFKLDNVDPLFVCLKLCLHMVFFSNDIPAFFLREFIFDPIKM